MPQPAGLVPQREPDSIRLQVQAASAEEQATLLREAMGPPAEVPVTALGSLLFSTSNKLYTQSKQKRRRKRHDVFSDIDLPV